MIITDVTITDPKRLREVSTDPNFISENLYTAPATDHKFRAGETRILVGLTDFPEYNGESVTVVAIRQDGPNGKAYYVQGRINAVMNWVYETRLA